MSTQTAVGHKVQIEVLYNGLAKPLAVEPHQQMTAVVELAAHLFGITQNVHTLALFRPDGTEIAVNQSAEAAHIKAGERLALRPSAVRGG